jgi:hypothetical protein
MTTQRVTRPAPRVNIRVGVPDIRPFRPEFRPVATEIQRSTLTGGWETIAMAETPEWAALISAALGWLESPELSEAM